MVVAPHKPLLTLTAGDLMSRTLVLVPREMSLSGAARLLAQAQVSGAPVVDASGTCVGVLSATDFMHWAERGGPAKAKQKNNVCYAWQIIDPESLPETAVGDYMTADPVTVAPAVRIGELARMMRDAHIHRVIVVDKSQQPIGIVSTTDILAALARADREHPAEEAEFIIGVGRSG